MEMRKEIFFGFVKIFIVIILLFSCSKNNEIREKVIEIFFNHSYYNLSYDELVSITKKDVSSLRKVDKNFNIINLTRGRAKTNKHIEIGKFFYPFIIKKDFSDYKIIYVFKNSKAEKKGLSTSVIYKINNIEINDKTQKDLEYLLEASDSVDITFEKDGKPVSMKVEKESIFFPFVLGFSLKENVRYIRILGFFQNSDVSFRDILAEKPLNTVVFDLRDLKMGDYKEAAKIAGFFVSKNNVIYHIKSSKKIYNTTFTSNDGSFSKVKIIILVNRKTSFLGEILAASLKENNNAIIIGEKTAGNFYLTKAFDLPDKRFCILSVAKLYLPSNKEMDFVEPDHYYEDNEEKNIDKLNYIIDTDPLFNEILNRYI
jgi:carboxyl-terminal processing protease